jgi:gentisate 1,2-dioxygenase
MEAVRKRRNARRLTKKIDGESSALWNVLGDLVTPEPWLLPAASVEVRSIATTPKQPTDHRREAERRCWWRIGLRGQSKGHDTAVCRRDGSGDLAPAHQHSQSALRFVLEGGCPCHRRRRAHRVEPGDFVITPDDLARPSMKLRADVWLDRLDIPMVQFFDASLPKSGEDQQKTQTRR